MKTTLLTSLEDLQALAPAWSDLLGRSSADVISLTPDWLLTWWRTFGALQGRRLCSVAFHDGDRLIGLAPLNARRHWYRPCLPFRRIEFLGSGEPLDDAICSDYLNVIAENGRETEVARSLAEMLHAGKLGPWDELVLETLAGDGPMPGLLAEALKRDRSTLSMEPYDTSTFFRLPVTWEAFLASLDGKDRKHAMQSLRYLDEWSPEGVVLRFAEDDASLAEGKAILVELHHQRWANQGTFRGSHFLAFHDAMLPALLAAGKLQLCWIVAQGRPLAAAYCMVHAGQVWYYQTGRRLDVPNKIRPGIVLVLKLLQRAIAQGQREFDFLPGEAAYKKQFANATRPILRLRLARATWVESLRVWSRKLLRPAVRVPATETTGAEKTGGADRTQI